MRVAILVFLNKNNYTSKHTRHYFRWRKKRAFSLYCPVPTIRCPPGRKGTRLQSCPTGTISSLTSLTLTLVNTCQRVTVSKRAARVNSPRSVQSKRDGCPGTQYGGRILQVDESVDCVHEVNAIFVTSRSRRFFKG